MSTILYVVVVVGVVEGEDEDEGDTFAISKTMALCYTCVKAML